jgi:hypothetical protein
MWRMVGRALILGVLAAVFWQWRFLSAAPTSGPIGFATRATELYTQYIPVLSRAAAELRSGHLPLWNPDQLAGVPMLPSWFEFGVFYPLNLLYLLVPIHLAIGWTTCLHIAVAGAAMWWLAAVIGLPPAGAWFAAVVFMLSRPFASEPNLFNAMALAPAVVAAWWRLAAAPGARSVALAAALLALQISTGGSQMVLYTGYAAMLFFVASWWRNSAAVRLERALACAAAALALAAGAAAVFLLPTSTLAPASGRTLTSLSLEATLPFATPTIGELIRELTSGAPGLPRAFFGWSALALAALGLVASPRRAAALAALAALLLGALIVLGPNTPLYAVYYRLPTGNWYRFPQRAVLLVGIGVALLAGLGAERLTRRSGRWAVALVVLPAVELFRATWSTIPYTQVRPSDAIAPPDIVEQLRQRLDASRGYIVVNWSDRFPYTEKLGTWAQLGVAQDYDALTPSAYAAYVRGLMGSAAAVDPLFAGRYFAPTGGLPARRALDLLGVRVLILAPGSALVWDGVPYTAPADEPILVDNGHALPRAFLVHRVESVPDRAHALQRLRDVAFNPRMAAVVVGGRSLTAASGSPAESAEIVDDGDGVTVRAHVEQSALLVLSDLFLAGWTATVDGVPAEIVATNGIFRGVYLEPGDHEIRFTYRPRVVGVGLALSLASGLALVTLAWWPRRSSPA